MYFLSMPKLLIFSFLGLLLFSGCPNDRGEQLFQLIYPPIDFTLTPGQPAFQSLVIARQSFPTGYSNALSTNNVSPDEVDEVGGFFARVVSLSGEDFSEYRNMELRLCPVDQANGCSQFDILFSIGDLFRRRDQVVNLNPGLRNFKELIETENVRFELVFTSGLTTTQRIDCRLEWGIRGVAR